MRDDESLPGVELDDPSSLGSIDDSISSESASLMIPRPIDEARPAELVYAPGQHVASGLRLVHKVGEGGMGEVWRAYHARRGCEVAVKLISATAWAQKNARLRFEREGKVGRMITHPHVVQLLEEGTTAQGLPFLVLELLEGEPLEALLARQPRLSVAEVSRIVLQTASALQEAHRVGVVHRDIKPENIFLVRPPPEIEIKLFDFGIAKKASGHQTKLTAVGTLLGTPFYMNPEQLLDAAPVDYHADLWALSAVAYTALCGTTVFEADTMLGLVKAMRRLAIVPLSAHRPDIGPRLDAFFDQAFARDREHRFTNAWTLACAFLEAAGPVDGLEASVLSTTVATSGHLGGSPHGVPAEDTIPTPPRNRGPATPPTLAAAGSLLSAPPTPDDESEIPTARRFRPVVQTVNTEEEPVESWEEHPTNPRFVPGGKKFAPRRNVGMSTLKSHQDDSIPPAESRRGAVIVNDISVEEDAPHTDPSTYVAAGSGRDDQSGESARRGTSPLVPPRASAPDRAPPPRGGAEPKFSPEAKRLIVVLIAIIFVLLGFIVMR